MNILIPIKRVVDPYAQVKPMADGSGLDLGSAKFDINPFDEIAMEEGVRQKEKNGAIKLTAVSIGTGESEEQLRKALAIGADEAILIETGDDLDSGVVAAELAALAREIQPEVIILGKQATDNDSCQAGQKLAALLDWPQATFAAKVEIGAGTVTVTRETDTGEETLELPIPCVVTTDLRLNEPRYIALPGIIKARSKPLSKRPRLTDVLCRTKTLRYDAPPTRTAGVKVGSVDELIAALKDRGAL